MTPLETWAFVPFWLLGVATFGTGLIWIANQVMDWRR